MALPPERVSIKRKRDAESVDVLFIQDSKRARTQQFFFQRVVPQHEARPLNDAAYSSKPEDASSNQPAAATTASRPSSPSKAERKPSRPSEQLKARRFHLQKPLRKGVRGHGGIKKSRANTSSADLAVFLESRPATRQAVLREGSDNLAPPSPTKKTLLDASRQLRPRASAAELRWRQEHLKSGSNSRSASRGPAPSVEDPQQLKLAEELRAFALQESAHSVRGTDALPIEASRDQDTIPKKPLKFQPNPLAARNRRPPNEDFRMTGSVELPGHVDKPSAASDSDGNEDEFEYDTYIRVPYIDGANFDQAIPHAFEGKSVGLLVIEEGDEELWGIYAQEEDEYDADPYEEDENAEDHPNNDYGDEEEDELYHSDDEEAGFVYLGSRKRHGSDDEEYGNGDSDSDGDFYDAGHGAYSRSREQGSEPWANEFASPVQNRGLDPY